MVLIDEADGKTFDWDGETYTDRSEAEYACAAALDAEWDAYVVEAKPPESSIEDLTAIVLESLAAKADGRDFDEEAASQAIEVLAGVTLVQSGLEIDDVERKFQAPHTCHASYTEADGLSISIEWHDAPEVEVA
jgi:hypothetical protein